MTPATSDPGHTLAELSAMSRVPVRTIRYYLAQGLLPAPGRDGPATRYPESALQRLLLIRRLQREHQPLAEIRAQLTRLTDEEIAELASDAVDQTGAPPATTALDYIRSVLGEGEHSAALSPTAATPRPPTAAAAPSLLKRIDLARPAAAEAPPTYAAPGPDPKPAPEHEPQRSQWDRIVLEPDIEIHVRRPLSRIQNRRVERLMAFARQLLEEDQP